MAGRLFVIPFATSGDRAAVPDPAQPSGAVSFTAGFTPDYELPNTDPDYKPVPRDQTNELYHVITEALGIIQKQGAADWFDPAVTLFNYALNARVFHVGKLWRSNVAANAGEPGVGATWVDISTVKDTINAPLATVAAAATIDLTAGAPDTSQLLISGAGVNIANFTVGADRFFVTRFSGANTLVNSANLVTNRAANIVTAAGDTCLMRSTAANVVEILCGSFLSERAVGVGQTWQSFLGSRSSGVSYTNTTGRTIKVNAWADANASAQISINMQINGVTVDNSSVPGVTGGTGRVSAQAEVPAGAAYVVTITGSGASFLGWVELR